MDLVETAAADTTSDPASVHPPFPAPPPHTHTPPLNTTRCLGSPVPKRMRLTDPPGVGGAPGAPERLRRYSRSGRLLPVGIAQPIRSVSTPSDNMEDLLKPPPGSPFDPTTELDWAGPVDEGAWPVAPEDDSDHSSQEDVTRFNKFTNESRSCPLVGPDEREEEGCLQGGQQEPSSWLPLNTDWHVFVTHSTVDSEAVRLALLAPLHSAGLQATASCLFMPDHSCYDNKAIQTAAARSCVTVVALSKAYLDSSRCQKEQQFVLGLGRQGAQPRVVVAALGPCSRPSPLKKHGCLYLDFIDQSKQATVWKKLMETIEETRVSLGPPPSLSPPDYQGSWCRGDTASGGEEGRVCVGEGASGSSDLSVDEDVANYVAEGYDVDHHRKLEDEFEQDFQQLGSGIEVGGEVDGEGEGKEREGEGGGEPKDPRGVDISATVGLLGGVEGEEGKGEGEEGKGEEGEEEEEGKGEVDVEEGEVSDSSSEATRRPSEEPQSCKVASFYDRLARPDADRRNESPIFHMRNFNNWVKSVLIRSFLLGGATVLDLCCGKGGDLLKWKEGGIDYLVCADISEESIEQCRSRYHSRKMLDSSTREAPYGAEFIVADVCEVRLRTRYTNPARRFNFASCQFSLHYSFESYERAHMMLRNACENLRPGGRFIGTTVDSNEIVRRLREAGQRDDGTWFIGNEIYSVTLDPKLDPRDRLPLFGAIYNFKLHGVVDLPEFLVHMPLLISMLKDFDMELILQQNFYDFFNERRTVSDDAHLLFRMQAFDKHSGTMSASLWDAIGLYLVFVFEKRPVR